jgi:hypothetical protein
VVQITRRQWRTGVCCSVESVLFRRLGFNCLLIETRRLIIGGSKGTANQSHQSQHNKRDCASRVVSSLRACRLFLLFQKHYFSPSAIHSGHLRLAIPWTRYDQRDVRLADTRGCHLEGAPVRNLHGRSRYDLMHMKRQRELCSRLVGAPSLRTHVLLKVVFVYRYFAINLRAPELEALLG